MGTRETGNRRVVGFDVLPLTTSPFPHVVRDGYLEPDLLSELQTSFPSCPWDATSTRFSLYPDDAAYQDLVASSPAWSALHTAFHSQAFVDWAQEQFADALAGSGFKARPGTLRYVDHLESRPDKESFQPAAPSADRTEVFVRMDLHQGRVGYQLPVHVDRARRLVAMLLYLSDPREVAMEGGELRLHRAFRGRGSRDPVVVEPLANRMVAFPCTSRSWHSVSEITAADRSRDYLQVRISSRAPLWSRPLSRERVRHSLTRRPPFASPSPR